jgi:hypothetical protein
MLLACRSLSGSGSTNITCSSSAGSVPVFEFAMQESSLTTLSGFTFIACGQLTTSVSAADHTINGNSTAPPSSSSLYDNALQSAKLLPASIESIVRITNGSSPTLHDLVFYHIVGESALLISNDSNPILDSITFYGNTLTVAPVVVTNASATIQNCTIALNSSPTGGIYIQAATMPVLIQSSTVCHNMVCRFTPLPSPSPTTTVYSMQCSC